MTAWKRTRCAIAGCGEPLSPPSSRYCEQHKREHAALLLADLAAIERRLRP